MDCTRRTALQLGSTLGVTTLAGCAALPIAGPRLSVTLLNYTATDHALALEILRAGGRERSEARVLQDVVRLPPPEAANAAAKVQKPDVVESRPYRVRARLADRESVQASYHFYPDCSGGEEPNDQLYVAVHGDDGERPAITFEQNYCSDDAWWY